MNSILIKSSNIVYSDTIAYQNTELLRIISLMTISMYLDSYLYSEYFQKSNLVLGIF